MLVLTAALASFIGFALLAATYDRIIGQPTQRPLLHVSTRVGQAGGFASLLLCGGASVAEFGWGLGLVAWAGWLAVGALGAFTVLTLSASRRKPAPQRGRRERYDGSADFKPQ